MASEQSVDHPNVIGCPPLIFAGRVIGGTLLHFAYPIRVTRYSVSLSLGVILAIVAAWVAIRAERVMKAAGTNVRPDRPALKIVTSGPYRFTRNPMYLALCLLQLALGFLLDGWVPVLFALLLGLILHFGVILREESYLERKFGEEYLSFKRQVRRWL
jgi:protein-S-isoprenylcysteine O-methyltransferase Ste14